MRGRDSLDKLSRDKSAPTSFMFSSKSAVALSNGQFGREDRLGPPLSARVRRIEPIRLAFYETSLAARAFSKRTVQASANISE